MWYNILICLGLLSSLYGPALAEVEPGRSEVSLSLGHLEFGEKGLRDATIYGGRYTYNATDRYAFQGAVGVGFSSFSGSIEGRTVEDEPTTVFIYHLDVLYKFRLTERIVPFTTMGIGGITENVRGSAPRTETTFNFGGGLRVFPGGRVVLSLEIRNFFSSINIGGFSPSSGIISIWPSGVRKVSEISGSIAVFL